MKIYTKKGDGGNTNLLKKSKISKDSPVIEVLGSLDELNASLGFLHSSEIKSIQKQVIDMQNTLFFIGAQIAGSTKEIDFDKKTLELEKEIEKMQKLLPPINHFIIPGGTISSSYLHTCRVICRRLERHLVKMGKNEQYVKFAGTIKYVNRLSDLLFVMARFANFKSGKKDIIWES